MIEVVLHIFLFLEYGQPMSTIRQQIIELLEEQQMNARDLTQALSIMEKEVYQHLEHIDRSIVRQKKNICLL